MKKQQRSYLAIGELATFLVAWMLGILVVVDFYRETHDQRRANDLAATQKASSVLIDSFE